MQSRKKKAVKPMSKFCPRWVAWLVVAFFIGQCHFLEATTNDNSCKSFMVAKPKEWLEFLKNLYSFNTQLRLTFCTLKAIFKQLNRWQSTPESGKTRGKKEKIKAWKCQPIALLLHSMIVVKGLGCVICRLVAPFIPVTKMPIALLN